MTDRDASGPSPVEPPEPSDRFYRGTVLRVHHGRGTGLILTGNGREVPFVAPIVEVLDGRTIGDLAEGMRVGFDVGWTSSGLRVTLIKIG